ncbi:MAG TPA: HD domain-containing phosphohydrolase [Dermatophilaceae bacterium]|nr:HD domain-containing phosphohydrolase [Dermatophilaceae bacterium]
MTGVRLALPVVALSVVSDLTKGFAEGQALRAAVLGVRIADRLGMSATQRRDCYWVSLLHYVGCTATAGEMAAELGDEIAVSAAFAAVDPSDLREVVASAFRLHRGRPDRFLEFMVKAPAVIRRHEVASCEVAGLFAAGVGLPENVVLALRAAFERYDGRGHPGAVAGADIPVAARVAQVAQLAEFAVQSGVPNPAAVLRRAAGRSLDPSIVAAVTDRADELLANRARVGPREALDAEPLPHVIITEQRLDATARAIGALVDLKSSYFVGHSDRVAGCAAAAARRAGLPPAEVQELRRAGWLHDVGRASVSSRIWDKRGALTAAEWELVRLHPHYSQRVLGQVPGWEALGRLVAGHHERLDGSGYPAGTSGRVTLGGAILAAADMYCTLGEARPHRSPLTGPDRATVLRRAVEAGQLDGAAVAAVLAAAPLPRGLPAGGAPLGLPDEAAPDTPAPDRPLTAREREVLGLVAHGLTNAAVGRRLGISAKTVNAHLEHVYAKLGVSCRAAAVFHAARSGVAGIG